MTYVALSGLCLQVLATNTWKNFLLQGYTLMDYSS